MRDTYRFPQAAGFLDGYWQLPGMVRPWPLPGAFATPRPFPRAGSHIAVDAYHRGYCEGEDAQDLGHLCCVGCDCPDASPSE